MTAKENVLINGNDAQIRGYKKKIGAAGFIYEVHVEARHPHGAPYRRVLSIELTENEAWEEAWIELQQDMIDKLAEQPMNDTEKLCKQLADDIRNQIDNEIISLILETGK